MTAIIGRDDAEVMAPSLGRDIAPVSADTSGPDGPSGSRPGADSDGASAAGDVPVSAARIALAGALSTAAAAWVATRLFVGVLPIGLAALGVALGAGLTYLSTRGPRGRLLQYAPLPVAAVVGAVFASSGAPADSSVPELVTDAIRGGGLLQPPIPFDAGWKFLVIVLFAFVAAGANLLAVGLRRPKLAVGIPLPLALGAAVLQPEGSALTATVVALVLMSGGLAVAYGADMAGQGVSSGAFEIRRLAKAAVLMAAAVVGIVIAAQTDLLFPSTERDEVIPPQKPPTPPPGPDRELFTVRSTANGPWRVGVLDVYQSNAFLLPSVDPKRFREVPTDGRLSPIPVKRPAAPLVAEFSITGLKGQTLVGVANPVRIADIDSDALYDPRTQVVRLVDRNVTGRGTYRVEAAPLPDGPALAASPAPGPLLAEFSAMPPPPPGVAALLAEADTATTNRFDRLQFVRAALYTQVIAAGGGSPVDVPPARVDELLGGGEATPFEITAAEVMLARWAGFPARLGFGFFGGQRKGEVTSFRPVHGAAWLEAYFEGFGWIPIIGTPPKAKPSLSKDKKNEEPNVVPTDELAVSVYVPVDRQSTRLLYEFVRFYLLRGLPLGALGVLVLVGYPAVFKLLRSSKRRRWAAGRGELARVIVAYAELRDRCHDLNIGRGTDTPLEFVLAVDDDDEHEELAWLVTRQAWGDLARDLRIEDVESAEAMARSVTRRIDTEQTALMRIVAWASRTSLRDPWSLEVPNNWPGAVRRQRLALEAASGARPTSGSRGGRSGLLRSRLRFRRRAAGIAAALAAVLAIGGCSTQVEASAPSSFPDPLLPGEALGRFTLEGRPEARQDFRRPGRTALVSDGRLFTVREGDTIQGSIQVSLFKQSVDGQDRNIQRGIEGDLGLADAFRTHRYGTARIRVLESAEEQIFLWFPPERNVMELFIMRKGFAAAPELVQALVAHQRAPKSGIGEPMDAVTTTTATTTITTDPVTP